MDIQKDETKCESCQFNKGVYKYLTIPYWPGLQP